MESPGQHYSMKAVVRERVHFCADPQIQDHKSTAFPTDETDEATEHGGPLVLPVVGAYKYGASLQGLLE
jgi:hypothetical protein